MPAHKSATFHKRQNDDKNDSFLHFKGALYDY